MTDTTTTTATARTQKAAAELSDHISVYADVMVNDNLFVKLGAVEVDLTTDDNFPISYGVYLFHVDAEDLGESIGRFAVIK